MSADSMITRLEEIVGRRKAEMPEGSYTTYLFQAGQDKILKKMGEGATETIIASKNRSHDEIIAEASDLLYHLLVLLAYHDIPFERVEQELEARHGQRES